MFRIRGFFSENELKELDQLLEKGKYVSGRATAGVAGLSIKSNLQIESMDPFGSQANQLVHQKLLQNEEFKAYAMPLKVSGITFSRYSSGMKYGDHCDNALNIGPQQVIRSDLSFTIFLSSPDEYEGGELVTRILNDENFVKYDRGDMVLYPSGLPHRVEEVTSGCRRVAIGWLQSTIPQQEHREILHAIFKVRNEILTSSGRSEHFIQLDFALMNLLRIWSHV
jgi:PKHD-type hydroxylase